MEKTGKTRKIPYFAPFLPFSLWSQSRPKSHQTLGLKAESQKKFSTTISWTRLQFWCVWIQLDLQNRKRPWMETIVIF
jgi:hypothetical protein